MTGISYFDEPDKIEQVFSSMVDEERESRRKHLEKLASINAGQTVYVEWTPNAYASVDIAPRDSEHGFTDRTVVRIPKNTPPQEKTNLDEDVWEIAYQRAELYHELGHILYSDWEEFEVYESSVDMEYKRLFKDWWNALEDARIERLLKTRLNVEEDLKAKNANLLAANPPGSRVSLTQAIAIALLEYKHPTGRLGKLLDENNDEIKFAMQPARKDFEEVALPLIEDYAPAFIEQGSPTDAYEYLYDMFVKLRDLLETYADPDTSTNMTKALGSEDDAENSKVVTGNYDVDAPEWSDEEEEQIEKQRQGDGDIETEVPEMDVKRDYDDTEYEDDGVDAPERKSARKWGKVLQKNYDENGENYEIGVPTEHDRNDFVPEIQKEAKRLSTPISREFAQRLKKERKTKKKGGQRTGKPDTSRMHKLKQGDTRVFKRDEKPDEKDYNCMILLDRSGSMNAGGKEVSHAEKGVGALAYALEDVGVDVGVIGFNSGTVSLEKPFSAEVDERKDVLFTDWNTGGTPMSDALNLARGRLEEEGGNPFIIVVADGEPDHRDAYRDELHECNFPVLGVYVSEDGEFTDVHKEESSYFHKIVYRKSTETLDGVRALAKQVMF